MKLCIKQHLFTFGSQFSVYDENGNEQYFIESEILTFGRKLHIYRTSDNAEVAYIEQQLFTFTPCYSVYFGQSHAFDITKRFTLFFSEYDIDGLGLSVDGDFLGHDYSVYRNGEAVATIYKEWFTFGDCYCLDIADENYAIEVMCAAIVIDCVAASRNN